MVGHNLTLFAPPPIFIVLYTDELFVRIMTKSNVNGYNHVYNECEHRSDESTLLRQFDCKADSNGVKNNSTSIAHIYISQFPFAVDNDNIFPPERAHETANCSNQNVRNQKFYAWKLLEKALANSLGLNIETLDIKRNENGKWQCSACYFSLSHSGSLVAVAVSKKPIGVDIEKYVPDRFSQALENRIVTKLESATIRNLDKLHRAQYLSKLWTQKEAIFKLSDNKSFQPKCIETSKSLATTKTVLCGDERYFITVASDDVERAVFQCTDDIELIDF